MKKRKRRGGVEFRKDRGKWGFRHYSQGRRYKRYAWDSREEARAALTKFKAELANKAKAPQLPPTALIVAVNAYIADSAADGRSQWRLDALRWNFQKVHLPFFGQTTPISSITAPWVKRLVQSRRQSGVKPKTIHHDVTNLNALLNWACKPRVVGEGDEQREVAPLLNKNPMANFDKAIIGNTRAKKAPLDLDVIDKARSVLDFEERCYFDFLRCTGARRGEANKVKWDDIDLDK